MMERCRGDRNRHSCRLRHPLETSLWFFGSRIDSQRTIASGRSRHSRASVLLTSQAHTLTEDQFLLGAFGVVAQLITPPASVGLPADNHVPPCAARQHIVAHFLLSSSPAGILLFTQHLFDRVFFTMRQASAFTAFLALLLPITTLCSRLTPPVLPLIVRNPYLSAWLSDARGKPWESWPMFWTGEHLGFSIIAGVPQDKTAYPLLGRPQDSLGSAGEGYNVSFPEYLGSHYDASTTNLSYIIHPRHASSPLEIVLSFLSPITPTSTLRQSIPAAYLNVYVKGDVDVNIYIDLNGQWVSGDRGNKIIWDVDHTQLKGQDDGLKTWIVRRDTEQMYTETRDQSEWGTLLFSAPSDVQHEAGTSAELRQRFARTGTLNNSADDHFRGIMDAEPVFAFSKSFRANDTATMKNSEKHVMFTIAHVQDPVVQYAAARGLTHLRPLWSSYMPTPKELVHFHWTDFDHVNQLAFNYSAQLAVDALKSGSEDYVDIVAVSARQVMGACHFLGTPEDPLLFMKEISSDGNTQTIDVIFPSFPFFLYTNPRWLAYLLEPLIEHMLSGQYPNKYAMHDIGAHYPNATGHPDGNDEYMPVEECGNILIAGLALVNSIRYGTDSSVSSTWQPESASAYLTGDDDKLFPLNVGSEAQIQYIDEPWNAGTKSLKQAQKWVTRSYRLWKQWTGYLVEYSLEPENQLSTDDFAGWLALQTNLALKGIIGIRAMADLAELAGRDEDVKTYKNTSEVYIAKWEELGISRDKTHAKVAYNWFGSWTTTYNLYADSLLCFHLEELVSKTIISQSEAQQNPLTTHKTGFVPRHIYQMQSDWYFAVRQKYGLPLDSRHMYTKTDWEFFSMAVAAPRVRADILQSVARWVNETSTDRPLTDLHDTEGSGGFPGPNFFARPVVGGHFAFLTLERACGGKAVGGLGFLRDDVVDRAINRGGVDVKGLLEWEAIEEMGWMGEL